MIAHQKKDVSCRYCTADQVSVAEPNPEGLRACSEGHIWREQSTDASKRLAYADPPYPGCAHLYKGHPDYAGEVDHAALIEQLTGYDGWALSTSAAALRDLLPLCPPTVRVLSWVKHTVTVSWEPLIVCSARKPDGVRDWIQVEPDSYQWREKPDSYVIGQKPEAFCLWMFAWLGAEPGDGFDDLFPGSGNVGRAWDRWCSQPGLPIARSVSADKRAGRRAAAKATATYEELA